MKDIKWTRLRLIELHILAPLQISHWIYLLFILHSLKSEKYPEKARTRKILLSDFRKRVPGSAWYATISG